MPFFEELFSGSIEHNCVFGAIVGAESLYLFLLFNRKRIELLWSMLVPFLLVYALIDSALRVGLSHTLFVSATPYITALLGTAAAMVLVRVHELTSRSPRLATDQEILLLASLTALFLAVSNWDFAQRTSMQSCVKAVVIWIGYGFGVLTFWSLGRKLRENIGSQARGIILLYLVLAIVGVILTGFSGLKL
jgi:hypothetical protein